LRLSGRRDFLRWNADDADWADEEGFEEFLLQKKPNNFDLFTKPMLHEELTKQIIGAFYSVYNTLGYGFLEKVYHNALLLELRSLGLQYDSQRSITVYYKDNIVGEYIPDIIVNNLVICEQKVVSTLSPDHEAQLINYLRATPIEVGLLLNFGAQPEFRRKAFSNSNKKL
jgi:GxxExxY protein